MRCRRDPARCRRDPAPSARCRRESGGSQRRQHDAGGTPHRVSAFRSFQPELPVTARPSRSRQKQNIDLGKLHRLTSNVGIVPLTDHHGWNREVFPCPVVFISWHLVSCTPHNQHFLFFLFRPFAGKMHFLQKRQDNAVTWCILVLVAMLLNISCVIWCLRVFRSRVKRIEKHSTGFSMFRTREHGCSDAELCCVRYRAPSGRFFFLPISISHARHVVNEVGRFSLTDGVE